MTALMQTGAGGDGGAPWWLAVLLALIALGGVVTSALLVRRSSKESTAIAELTVRLTRRNAMDTTNNAILTRLDGRLGAVELDRWRRREETMRMLRWASESAADEENTTLAGVGLAALEALGDSELLQAEDQVFIDKVLDAVLDPAISQYHEIPGAVEVVQEDEEGTGHGG
ncbi:MAG: hypothetical protein L0I76_29940 [Pseudonocardia sp.]|nr:hypothetical protein [Pseudonocardia sp.]